MGWLKWGHRATRSQSRPVVLHKNLKHICNPRKTVLAILFVDQVECFVGTFKKLNTFLFFRFCKRGGSALSSSQASLWLWRELKNYTNLVTSHVGIYCWWEIQRKKMETPCWFWFSHKLGHFFFSIFLRVRKSSPGVCWDFHSSTSTSLNFPSLYVHPAWKVVSLKFVIKLIFYFFSLSQET